MFEKLTNKTTLFQNSNHIIPKNEIKKTRLLHIFLIISYLFCIAFSIEIYINKPFTESFNNKILDKLIEWRFFVFFCFFVTSHILQYFKKYVLSRSLYIFTFYAFTLIFANFITKGILLEFLFILPPLLSLIFFENKKIIYLILLLSFCGFFIPNIFLRHYELWHINSVNNLAVFFCGFIIVTYFKKISDKNERDLEKRKSELEDINNFQSQFFINISHEIRTPLTLIKGEIEQLEDYEQQIPQLNTIKKGLNTEVDRITALVDNVLDLAKFEASNFDLNLKEISLTDLITKLHVSFETVFKQKKIHFNLSPINKDYIVQADSIQIERAISNVILNASKYTDSNGDVIISVNQNEEKIIVSIQDTGIGIPEAEIDKIYNQFYQAKNHINNSGGSGVGLSLTKEIIDAHNGSLKVKSTLGVGSSFIITLPLKDALALGSKITDIDKPEENTTIPINIKTEKGQTILLVEDNHKMSEYIIRVLNKNGYNCIHAKNGVEGLTFLEKNKFDFIVTDYMMPKMDGYEFIKELKARNINIPILMLTARNDNESRLNIFRLGIDDFLTKPFEPKEFIIRIENAINNYTKRTTYITEEKIPEKEQSDYNDWINEVKEYILKNCSNLKFKQIDISEHFNISESTLYRKIKTQTGLNPNNLIQEVKLQKAKKILSENPSILLKQLSLEVGFTQPSYFSEIYENRFGTKPSIKK